MFSAGTDPEGFAVDKDGIHRSLIGRLGGTKGNPMPTKHGFVQEDNVAWEFNTHPAHNEDEFVFYVLNTLGDINDLLIPLDLSIDLSPTASFIDGELEHVLAKQAGCEPDFNAWEFMPNDSPDLSNTNLRSAGGHLHIAWDGLYDIMRRIQMARNMDITAAIPSVIVDTDTKRRELYGKAGCLRRKFIEEGDAYDGIESRSLSNFWLRTERSVRWAYNSISQSIERFDELTEISELNSERIVSIINTSDISDARRFCNEFNIDIGEE